MERANGALTTASTGAATVELTHLCPTPDGNTINWTLEAGELVAMVGNAGSGKSRLCDIIYGLRSPLSGHLHIDGSDPRDLRPDVLRRRVALVRGVEFFEGTILENVHLERPSVSSADVTSVLERLGVLDELLSLPNGLGTTLPTGGGLLSSSQLRRLMLARSIVGQPGLLLIDGLLDGFSDAELAEVGSALGDLRGDCTIVVATGQRRVANLCERVLRMDSDSSDTSDANPSPEPT